MDNRAIELWLRRMAGLSLSDAERAALLQALKQEDGLRQILLADERFHGMMVQTIRSERDAEAFVRQCLARVHAERTGNAFAEAVQKRVDERARHRPNGTTAKVFRLLRRAPLAAAASLLLALGIGLWLSRTGPETPTPHGVIARVESVQGSVFGVQDAAPQRRALIAGDEIREGMRIETGADGAVTLAWVAEATSVEMAGNSKLETRNSKLAFLHQGQLTATVAPQPSDRPFAVETRHAVARVAGTRFELEARPELTKLTVREGAVDFTERFSGTTVRVSAGEYAVAIPGAPLAPTPIGTPLPVEYRWDFSEPADPDLFKVFRGQWRHVPPSESEYGLGYMETGEDPFWALIQAPVRRLPMVVTFETMATYSVTDGVTHSENAPLVFPVRAQEAVVYDISVSPGYAAPEDGTYRRRTRYRVFIEQNGTDIVVDIWSSRYTAPDKTTPLQRSVTSFFKRTDPNRRLAISGGRNLRILSIDIRSVSPDEVPDTSAFRKLAALIPRRLRHDKSFPAPDTPPFRELNVELVRFIGPYDFEGPGD